MATKTKTTKIDKVQNYLVNGKALTVRQASSRFDVKNLRATISALRGKGMNIVTDYTNTGEAKYYLAN